MRFRWRKIYLITAMPLYLFAIAACTTIDLSQKPPADWPKLRMEIRQNVPKLVKAYCPGFGIFGCSLVEFSPGTCLVMMTTDSQSDLDIELSHKHCDGYDHKGESTMADAWADYKKSGQNYRAEIE